MAARRGRRGRLQGRRRGTAAARTAPRLVRVGRPRGRAQGRGPFPVSGMGRRGRGGGAGEREGEARAARAGRRPGEAVERDAEGEGSVGKRDREASAAATPRERTAREGRWEARERRRGGARQGSQAEEPSNCEI
ncbi:hypothetical protein PVAP13_3KG362797 [Panicum virgatum]|uniref:Uncharacterized protein n=1 Tax=Panicum virgatum TaxID=38727 RepID=A0A8T0URF4_PANVG|nr:hypothetical protein PVAP13_3KG362797 [Panicum virgatum]